MNPEDELRRTIENLICPGKGILAADESLATIGKRFLSLGIENTDEARRAYRSLLFTAVGVEEFISGAILFAETLGQCANDGTLLPEVLVRKGIVTGIKVDTGTTPLENAPNELITQGLDGLAARLQQYKSQGARFVKWRAVLAVSDKLPTSLGIRSNADALARYAAICQAQGMVPIVEPEVLIDGDHSIERAGEVNESVLQAVFGALHRHKVILEFMVLKPSMVLPGRKTSPVASPEQVAIATVTALRRCVPAAVPGINFLSGGQGPMEATANLNAMNARFADLPWTLSFSYGRALQDPAMLAWGGHIENVDAAQQSLVHRARMNSLALSGRWSPEMEHDTSAERQN